MNGSKIMVVGQFCNDEFVWEFGVPLKDDGTIDAELQRLIDEGEQTAEYEDYLIDVEWLRGGC